MSHYLLKAWARPQLTKPHRTCSMWMTCVCALTKYARVKEPIEFDGVQDGGACDFPWSSSRIDCSTCGWYGDAPPSNPTVGVVVDQLCWKMKSIMALCLQVSMCKTDVPISGSWFDHQGSWYLYSLWSSCTSMTIETKGQISYQVHKPLWSVTA